jgi:hypothetical protein
MLRNCEFASLSSKSPPIRSTPVSNTRRSIPYPPVVRHDSASSRPCSGAVRSSFRKSAFPAQCIRCPRPNGHMPRSGLYGHPDRSSVDVRCLASSSPSAACRRTSGKGENPSLSRPPQGCDAERLALSTLGKLRRILTHIPKPVGLPKIRYQRRCERYWNSRHAPAALANQVQGAEPWGALPTCRRSDLKIRE